MPTDLLQALCAIAMLAVPLVLAWLIVGRDARSKAGPQREKTTSPISRER